MNKPKHFILGAVMLTLSGVVAKFLGVFFRIPLIKIIGVRGFAYYELAYPLYNTFLTLSTVGVPTAISKMVSERTAIGNKKEVNAIFRISFIILAILGLFGSIIMFLSSSWFSERLSHSGDVSYSLIALSAAPFLVAMISAFRGYFQGLNQMAYTSLSQLIDQVFRVAAGVGVSYLLMKMTGDAALGAAGAAGGASVGAFFALLFLAVSYLKTRDRSKERTSAEDLLRLGRELIIVAFPIACGSMATTIMGLVNSLTINRCLLLAGLSKIEALDIIASIGKVQTVLNVPFVIGASMSTSILPTISASMGMGEKDALRSKGEIALRVSVWVGTAASAGLFILSYPIMSLLYSDATWIDAQLLRVFSLSVFSTLCLSSMTAVLQGAGHFYAPVKNMVLGSVVKYVLNLVLIPNIRQAYLGSAWSTVGASFVIFLLDAYDLYKLLGVKEDIVVSLKIVFSTLMMAVVALLVYPACEMVLGARIGVCVTIFVCIVLYFYLTFFLSIFSRKRG
jgi:stage V sporulation protein B